MQRKLLNLTLPIGCAVLMGTAAHVFSQQKQPTPLKVLEVTAHAAKP